LDEHPRAVHEFSGDRLGGSAEDIKNRDIFEERVGMVLRCWQEESVVLDGRY